ncbi:hypothetical protein PF001_g16114 [Phytophthora fragariae]|uniref:Uncharacterized protein n=1 Tax=Phytophthora fragariae TaxID=53985 RepID=A0A6A4CWW0_9STRA|nr:hypothetical protein PF003_g27958 [Phytophthora fragariae]KAE9298047.1 hypothetical protein PF001_g16114 [Phytophthora fragariae]
MLRPTILSYEMLSSKCYLYTQRKVLVDSQALRIVPATVSVNYWAYGYDLYSPSRLGNILYHNYLKTIAPMDPYAASTASAPTDLASKKRKTAK